MSETRPEVPGNGDCLVVKLVRRGVVSAQGSYSLKRRGPKSKNVPVLFQLRGKLYAGFELRKAQD